MTFVNIKIIPYPLNGCQLLVIGCPEALIIISRFTKKTSYRISKTPSPLNVSRYLQQNLQSVILRRLARFLTLPAKTEESRGS